MPTASQVPKQVGWSFFWLCVLYIGILILHKLHFGCLVVFFGFCPQLWAGAQVCSGTRCCRTMSPTDYIPEIHSLLPPLPSQLLSLLTAITKLYLPFCYCSLATKPVNSTSQLLGPVEIHICQNNSLTGKNSTFCWASPPFPYIYIWGSFFSLDYLFALILSQISVSVFSLRCHCPPQAAAEPGSSQGREPEEFHGSRIWVGHDTGYETWACAITVCTCLMMDPMVEDLCKLFLFMIDPFHQVLQNRQIACETEYF